ncbi:hypothetical protein JCM8547_002716 [Rhodosporidiobolus lusitaniae]
MAKTTQPKKATTTPKKKSSSGGSASKKKSPYNAFRSRMTEELKERKPNQSGEDRRIEIDASNPKRQPKDNEDEDTE